MKKHFRKPASETWQQIHIFWTFREVLVGLCRPPFLCVHFGRRQNCHRRDNPAVPFVRGILSRHLRLCRLSVQLQFRYHSYCYMVHIRDRVDLLYHLHQVDLNFIDQYSLYNTNCINYKILLI